MADEQGFSHVDWSASTASLYQSCPRRFYYKYTRPEICGESSADDRSTVLPPGAKIGTVVHDCIEEQVLRWRTGAHLSFQDAQLTATEQLQAYVTANEEAISARYIQESEEDEREFARSLIRTAHNHLECFFQVIWPQLDTHQYILHEKTSSFEVDGQTVWVRPDLCTRTQDGDFVVTDWKTSLPDRFADPSLQVLTYALWAYQEYEPDLDRILVQLVHTKRGEFDRTRPSQADMDQIRTRIKRDYEIWRVSEEATDFEPEPAAGKCTACPFLQRCEAGQSAVEEPPP